MKEKSVLRKVLLYATLLFVLAVLLGPYLWMVLSAFKTQREIYLFPPTFLPEKWLWSNFVQAWHIGNFSRFFYNTALISIVSAMTNLLFGSMAAFAFSRMKFPGRDILFMCALATMMIPAAVLIVPLFVLLRSMPTLGSQTPGWINTYQGIIAPYAVTGFSIFLFKQYFMSIPHELDEAATIDGCGPWQIFTRIILPLSKPAITLVLIFTVLQRWNDYLWPLVAASDPSMFTLQVGLKYFQTEYNIAWHLLMSGSIIVALPIFILYTFLQPLFERGLGALGSGSKS